MKMLREVKNKNQGMCEETEKDAKDENITTNEDLKNYISKELDYIVRWWGDLEEMRAMIMFNNKYPAEIGWKIEDAKKHLISTVGRATILDRLTNAPHICVVVYPFKDRYKIINSDIILATLEDIEWNMVPLSTDHAVDERRTKVSALRNTYNEFIRHVRDEDIDDWSDKIRDVEDLVKYSKHIVGEDLYADVLLVFLQLYSMADIPIYSLNDGRYTQIETTGFSLAYYGDPGTGKTFATDDILRGNKRKNIPPHGVIGRMRYAAGVTAKGFIRILEAYQDYPVDWVIPEFRSFFQYAGMVEILKLVMERREVSYRTAKEKIGPYKVSSFFIVNYNLRLTQKGYVHTMNDPNFSAIEDRLICKLFVNTIERQEKIHNNMLRLSAGEVEFYLANTLRKHATYTYHYLTRYKPRVILRIDDYKDMSEWILKTARTYNTNASSSRILERSIQIAASAALVKALKKRPENIYITSKELKISKRIIEEDFISRTARA